jgi:hypothetical protein
MCAPRSIALTEGPGLSCGSAGTVNGCKRVTSRRQGIGSNSAEIGVAPSHDTIDSG